MSWYRKVDIRINGDSKYRSLSNPQPCGKALFHHLLFGPHTDSLPGLSFCGEYRMAEDLGWQLEGLREAFAEVSGKGMAKADWDARVVFVVNAVRYNPPESPNVVRGWAKVFDMIPECPLKVEWLQRVESFILNELKESKRDGRSTRAGFLEAFREAFPQPWGQGCVIPHPHPQPHPQPHDTLSGEAPDESCPVSRAKKPDPYEADIATVIGHLNDRRRKIVPGARDYDSKASGTRKHLRARLAEGAAVADCLAVVNDRADDWAARPDLHQYLRPSTLFNSEKFPQYLANVGVGGSSEKAERRKFEAMFPEDGD